MVLLIYEIRNASAKKERKWMELVEIMSKI